MDLIEKFATGLYAANPENAKMMAERIQELVFERDAARRNHRTLLKDIGGREEAIFERCAQAVEGWDNPFLSDMEDGHGNPIDLRPEVADFIRELAKEDS